MTTSRSRATEPLTGQKLAALGAGFTPSVRLLGELLGLFGEEEDTAKLAERAILRVEAQYAARVARAAVEAARAAERPARARLTRLAGRLAQDKRDPESACLRWLLEAALDGDPKTRRVAARSLGNVETGADAREAIEATLAGAFDRAPNDDDRRALAAALAKLGGEAAEARLAGKELGKTSVVLAREIARRSPGAIDAARRHPAPLPVWFHARSGLELVVEEELREAGFGDARFLRPGVVEATLDSPLSRALAIRTATHIGFPLPQIAHPAADLAAAALVGSLVSPAAVGIFQAFTSTGEGAAAIRFRLAFADGGHHRALIWRTAELVRERSNGIVNDPKASTWEVVVDRSGRETTLELVPRGFVDERFAWRTDVVAASSHPTIAAALARALPRRDDDVVWDPFAGAGAELVERARLGPFERLVASDIDKAAIAATKANLERAGIDQARVELAVGDSLTMAPAGLTAIVTNPPMGRRVHRGTHADVLDRFIDHAAFVLPRGGALVWMVPNPARCRARAEAAGLSVLSARAVDMGGFSAELSVYLKPR